MKIYVASSWRNDSQPAIVEALRSAGHDVYDFRHPEPGNDGFRWSDIDPGWRDWAPWQYSQALKHPIAKRGFALDMNALKACDACVYVLPCGRSASLELGYAVGAGKYTAAILADGEPELMLAMVDLVALSVDDVLVWLDAVRRVVDGGAA